MGKTGNTDRSSNPVRWEVISRDGGTAWTKWRHDANAMFPYMISQRKNASGWTLWGIYDSATIQIGGISHTPELLHYPSSGPPDSRPLPLPDTLPTSFRVRDDGTFWLGTWGKGIFVSADSGTTWTARNQGLGDLRIETLYRGPEGGLFVVTPDGVYRLGEPPGSPVQAPKGRVHLAPQTGMSQTLFGFPGHHFEYRLNGRRLPAR